MQTTTEKERKEETKQQQNKNALITVLPVELGHQRLVQLVTNF